MRDLSDNGAQCVMRVAAGHLLRGARTGILVLSERYDDQIGGLPGLALPGNGCVAAGHVLLATCYWARSRGRTMF